jgi:hypothetical protein
MYFYQKFNEDMTYVLFKSTHLPCKVDGLIEITEEQYNKLIEENLSNLPKEENLGLGIEEV